MTFLPVVEDVSVRIPVGWALVEEADTFVQLVPDDTSVGAVTIEVLARRYTDSPTLAEAKSLCLDFARNLGGDGLVVTTSYVGQAVQARTVAVDHAGMGWYVIVHVTIRHAVILSFVHDAQPSEGLTRAMADVGNML